MELTNLNFIKFCRDLLGAPYWFNASTIKATKQAFLVNSMRFPEEYAKQPTELYQKHIDEKEIVTDTIGLIKGFAWHNGGENIFIARGTDIVLEAKYCSNNCPDKLPNGFFTWACTQGAKWDAIEKLPEIPGIVVAMNDRIAIYDGDGYVIESSLKKGCLWRHPLSDDNWKYWYQIPFINYNTSVEVEKNIYETIESIQLKGLGVALTNVLFRQDKNENSKLLEIIKPNEKVEIYNDSSEKWLHIIYNGTEGYTLSEFFLIYPEKPLIANPDIPKEIKPELKGTYITTSNVSIKYKAGTREKGLVVLPKETAVICTGGVTGEWLHIYAEYNKRLYAGYMQSQYLRKV